MFFYLDFTLRADEPLLRVQAVKLRVIMKKDEVRVAAGPYRVPESRFPGFAQCIQGLRLSFQVAVQTSRIVKNRGLVGAQSNSQVEFAQGVVRPSQRRVVASQ